MIFHTCKYCNYSTNKKNNFNKHCLTEKHIKNKKENNTNNTNNKDIINKIELLTKEIKILKENNNQNTQTIVKEARVIKKSLLSLLNTNFKDTPSIDYIDEKDFKIHLEDEYNFKINDPDNKLFMRIFSDFQNRKLVDSMSNVIVRYLKKEDQKQQSVFNIDSSRGNYATKIQDIWHNDKKGLQLKKYTIDMMMKYMVNIMDIYRERLIEMNYENKIKKNIKVTDFIMEKQGLLLDINAFLTNPNTHKKIILNMCPELRMDDMLLLETS